MSLHTLECTPALQAYAPEHVYGFASIPTLIIIHETPFVELYTHSVTVRTGSTCGFLLLSFPSKMTESLCFLRNVMFAKEFSLLLRRNWLQNSEWLKVINLSGGFSVCSSSRNWKLKCANPLKWWSGQLYIRYSPRCFVCCRQCDSSLSKMALDSFHQWICAAQS